jgi:hypothetical protein
MQVGIRQRVGLRHDAIHHVHRGDRRNELGPAFEDDVPAKRLDARQMRGALTVFRQSTGILGRFEVMRPRSVDGRIS